jgi:hypothetical protein
VTAEILQRYLEMEASLLLGWLMKFPGAARKAQKKMYVKVPCTELHAGLGACAGS